MTFVLLIGPPAVGKMAVGLALEARTGLTLFHNHMSIELALRFFDHGTPRFSRLVGEIRRQVLEGVAEETAPAGGKLEAGTQNARERGLILTLVWDFDDPRDAANAQAYADLFAAHGHRVIVVELEAPVEARLARNATTLRLAHKPSKRDLAASNARLVAASQNHRLNYAHEFDAHPAYLRVNNTHRSPTEVADAICERFGLARAEA